MRNREQKADEPFCNSSNGLMAEQKKLLELEGVVKIDRIIFLRIQWPKAIILTILLACTVLGLVLLKLFKQFRVLVFYSEVPPSQATYVFCETQDGIQEIEQIEGDEDERFVYFKKLKYQLTGNKIVPVGFNLESNLADIVSKRYLAEGLSEQKQQEGRQKYGRNEHKVDIPSYFSFMFDTLTGPFYLMQYLVCVALIVEGLILFAAIMLFFTVFTTSINYLLLYFSYVKIREMAEKVVKVRVKRNGVFEEVDNHDLVPGDVIDPEREIQCDCLLASGDIFVDEANLTGESIPIGKFPFVHSPQTVEQNNNWLFEGSRILEKKGDTLAIVIHIGYASRRGRIIRKILSRVAKTPTPYWKGIQFLGECFLVAIIIYFATLPFTLSKNISDLFVGFRFIDFLSWSFPTAFPIFFNTAYSFSLRRLGKNNISGTEPEKTLQSASLHTMCFDKTGTLTENDIQVHDIFLFRDSHTILRISDAQEDVQKYLVLQLFASCHTVKQIEGQFMGDQVDLRMFLYSGFQLVQSADPSIKFIVDDKRSQIEVLRINQFQSQFQSMSVLARDKSDGKIYSFVKGAPEKIETKSILKVEGFQKKVVSLSLGGYRTIGFGYKEIPTNEVDKYLSCPREEFEENITALGLVGFENKLKHDTKQMIKKLKVCEIEPKMITGDNIFIAVQTGTRASIINPEEKVILLEGRKQRKFEKGADRKFKGILLSRQNDNVTEEEIQLDEGGNYLYQDCSIAVDNDFLMQDPRPVLTEKMKLFARISPENKAMVVRMFKDTLSQDFQKQSCGSRFFGAEKKKVGMCGDGANDLIAIREADVGIGISNSDASYGASFTIREMADIDQLIRESKCACANIVEMFRYYGSTSFLKITCSLLLMSDTTYFSDSQLTYTNFTSTIIIPIFMALSSPSPHGCPFVPETNFMGVINHVRYWGNVIIPSGGLIGGYFYLVHHPDFVPNQTPEAITQFHSQNMSTTIMFLMALIPFSFGGIFLYSSHPWKPPLSHNSILLIIIILNIASSITLFFITPQLTEAFGTVAISNQPISICFAIMAAATVLQFFFNKIVDQVELHPDYHHDS